MDINIELGRVYMTNGIESEVEMDDVIKALMRYTKGDWGELEESDKELNNRAIKDGERIFAKYYDKNKKAFYIITEWDRSVTTILLPSEY